MGHAPFPPSTPQQEMVYTDIRQKYSTKYQSREQLDVVIFKMSKLEVCVKFMPLTNPQGRKMQPPGAISM